jgi:ElaB/YqjD/DUF883 family membrane-anchored ribosome-binding protein
MTGNGEGTEPAAAPRVAVGTLLRDWRELLTRCVEEAERFTRERPSAGLAAAFVAGLLAGGFLRRR